MLRTRVTIIFQALQSVEIQHHMLLTGYALGHTFLHLFGNEAFMELDISKHCLFNLTKSILLSYWQKVSRKLLVSLSSHSNICILKPNFKFSIPFAALPVKKQAQASCSHWNYFNSDLLTHKDSPEVSAILLFFIINTYYSENSG